MNTAIVIRNQAEQEMNYPAIDALAELELVTSPKQIKKMADLSQNIASMGVTIKNTGRDIRELQEKVNRNPDLIRLKEMKKELKKKAKVLDSAIDMLNGSYSTLLADFMPGKPTTAKLQAIKAAYSNNQKQLGGV